MQSLRNLATNLAVQIASRAGSFLAGGLLLNLPEKHIDAIEALVVAIILLAFDLGVYAVGRFVPGKK